MTSLPEELNRALDVNLRVPMLMTQQLLPGMLRRGRGHCVCLVTIAGKVPGVRVPIYLATKAGLGLFCRCFGRICTGSGVSASSRIASNERTMDTGCSPTRIFHPHRERRAPHAPSSRVASSTPSSRTWAKSMPPNCPSA